LVSSQNHTIPAAARASDNSLNQTADLGARLDHRGLHDVAYLSALAETGAQLDHRGLRTTSTVTNERIVQIDALLDPERLAQLDLSIPPIADKHG
jgi:hypothetical protein